MCALKYNSVKDIAHFFSTEEYVSHDQFRIPEAIPCHHTTVRSLFLSRLLSKRTHTTGNIIITRSLIVFRAPS